MTLKKPERPKGADRESIAAALRRIRTIPSNDQVRDADFITDLLADIRHYCDSWGIDFAENDQRAYGHYCAELHGDPS